MAERDYALEYGNRCRQVRMAKGISQSELAEKMHVSSMTVSKWERNGIANVNTVMELSEVLGQDITCDQIDQEGIVGEIGQEILCKLVENHGFMDYSDLKSKMFGLSDDRIGTELFKLERIGNIVREQYKDFVKQEQDAIFITAKGIITIKNIKKPLLHWNEIDECISYEQWIGDHHSLQDVIDSDEISQILWNMPYKDAYRIDYIQYLINNYRQDSPHNTTEEDIYHYISLNESALTGESGYIDILYRMAFGISNDCFDEAAYLGEIFMEEDELIEEEEDSDYDKLLELAEMDETEWTAQRFFNGIFPWLEPKRLSEIIDAEKLNGEEKAMLEGIKEEEEDLDHYMSLSIEEELRGKFFEHIDEENAYNCAKWFTTDQVKEFIEKNYYPAKTEVDRQIDEIISEINERIPESLDYFYTYPKKWEDAGIGKMIREMYHIPERTE